MSLCVIIAGVIGILIGTALMAWAVAVGMRRLMVVEHPSQHGFEETVKRIHAAVEKAEGWVLPIPEWHFSDAMIKHGKPFGSVNRLVVFFLCKAAHAQNMVNAAPQMASIMPCGWAVYERDGKTYIGSMNIPMMALPFKGIVKRTFQAVGREEKAMFEEILK